MVDYTETEGKYRGEWLRLLTTAVISPCGDGEASPRRRQLRRQQAQRRHVTLPQLRTELGAARFSPKTGERRARGAIPGEAGQRRAPLDVLHGRWRAAKIIRIQHSHHEWSRILATNNRKLTDRSAIRGWTNLQLLEQEKFLSARRPWRPRRLSDDGTAVSASRNSQDPLIARIFRCGPQLECDHHADVLRWPIE